MESHEFYGNNSSQQLEEIDWVAFKLRLFIFVTGIGGNFLLIFVIVFRNMGKRSTTSWYVLQLAVIDAMFLLTLPFKMVEDVKKQWIYTTALCKGKETVLFLNYYTSILFLTIMSVDRYIAVCHGFSNKLQKFRSQKASLAIISSTWIISFCLSVPAILFSGKHGVQPNCICTFKIPTLETPEEICLKEGIFKEDIVEFEQCVEFHKLDECADGFNISSLLYASYYDEGVLGDGAMYDQGWIYDYDEMNNTLAESDYGRNLYPDYALLFNDSMPFEGTISARCHFRDSRTLFKSLLMFNFVGMYLIPLLVISFCLVKVFSATSKPRPRSNTESETPLHASASTTLERRQMRRRLASANINKTCLLMCSLFAISWFPWHVVHMLKLRGIPLTVGKDELCVLLPYAASFIARMKSAFNPFIYFVFGAKRNLTRRLSRKRNDSKPSIVRNTSSI